MANQIFAGIAGCDPLEFLDTSSSATAPRVAPVAFSLRNFYPSQIDTSEQVLAALSSLIDADTSSQLWDFVIFTPPRISLRDQTLHRLFYSFVRADPELGEWLESMELVSGKPSQQEMDGLVFDPKRQNERPAGVQWIEMDRLLRWCKERVLDISQCRQRVPSPRYRELLARVKRLQESGGRMLVIHDESHWGANANGQAKRMMLGSREDNILEEEPDDADQVEMMEDLCSDNVFFVHLSATCWNGSHVRDEVERTVVNWESLPPAYNGSANYKNRENGHTLVSTLQHQMDGWVQQAGVVRPEKVSQAFVIGAMVDYALALLLPQLEGPAGATAETKTIVKRLQDASDRPDKLIMIRVPSGGYQPAFCKWLCAVRDRLPLDHPMKQWKVASNGPESEVEYGNFQELEGMRVLLVVVETAKMGDTLPEMSWFDLRCRYLSDSSFYSSFYQDLGRVFGYREHIPGVVLSEVAWDWLETGTRKVDPLLTRAKREVKPEEGNFNLSANQKSMWHNLKGYMKEHVETHRVFLSAEPQVGKTGSFLHLIGQLVQPDQYKHEHVEQDMEAYLKSMNAEDLQLYWNGHVTDFHPFHLARASQFVPAHRKIINAIHWPRNKETVLRILDLGCGGTATDVPPLLQLLREIKDPKAFQYVGVDLGATPYDSDGDSVQRCMIDEFLVAAQEQKKFDVIVACDTWSWNQHEETRHLEETVLKACRQLEVEFGQLMVVDFTDSLFATAFAPQVTLSAPVSDPSADKPRTLFVLPGGQLKKAE